MYQSIQGQRFWNAGIALRQTLYEFSLISPSGSPTEEQMKVLVPMAQATTKAWNGLQTATIVHASFSPIPPIACLIVRLFSHARPGHSVLTIRYYDRSTLEDSVSSQSFIVKSKNRLHSSPSQIRDASRTMIRQLGEDLVHHLPLPQP